MDRITEKMIKQWLESWNNGEWGVELQLRCENGWRYICTVTTGMIVAQGKTCKACWEDFEAFRRGFMMARDLNR